MNTFDFYICHHSWQFKEIQNWFWTEVEVEPRTLWVIMLMFVFICPINHQVCDYINWAFIWTSCAHLIANLCGTNPDCKKKKKNKCCFRQTHLFELPSKSKLSTVSICYFSPYNIYIFLKQPVILSAELWPSAEKGQRKEEKSQATVRKKERVRSSERESTLGSFF